MSYDITVEAGTSIRLLTSGKYCNRDIKVTATSGDTQESYDKGYTDGEKVGYGKGYAAGHDEGLKAGRDLGHEEGYAEGYNAGNTAGYEIGHEEGYSHGVSDAWGEAYQTGQKDEQERFWDVFQNSGRRTEYRNAFYSWLWKDSIYNPKYPIVCRTNSSEMFRYNTSITDTKVDIDFSNHTGTTSNVFNGASALKTIRKLIVNANITYITTGTSPTGWFDKCTALENITFDGVIGQNIDFSACPLTKESLLNIIEHLKDYNGTTTTKTLTIGSTNKAKLTTTEIAVATQKGWTVA